MFQTTLRAPKYSQSSQLTSYQISKQLLKKRQCGSYSSPKPKKNEVSTLNGDKMVNFWNFNKSFGKHLEQPNEQFCENFHGRNL